jgi:hypothetical protein
LRTYGVLFCNWKGIKWLIFFTGIFGRWHDRAHFLTFTLFSSKEVFSWKYLGLNNGQGELRTCIADAIQKVPMVGTYFPKA